MSRLQKLFMNLKRNTVGITGLLLALLGMKIILGDISLENNFQLFGDLLFLTGIILFFYGIIKN